MFAQLACRDTTPNLGSEAGASRNLFTVEAVCQTGPQNPQDYLASSIFLNPALTKPTLRVFAVSGPSYLTALTAWGRLVAHGIGT